MSLRAIREEDDTRTVVQNPAPIANPLFAIIRELERENARLRDVVRAYRAGETISEDDLSDVLGEDVDGRGR